MLYYLVVSTKFDILYDNYIRKEELIMNKQRIILVAIAAVGAISTFLPWATSSIFGATISVSGLSGDGLFALVAFIVAAVIPFIGNRTEPLPQIKFGVVAAGAIGAIVALIAFINVGGQPMLSVGFGLYLSILVGIALAVVPFLKQLS